MGDISSTHRMALYNDVYTCVWVEYWSGSIHYSAVVDIVCVLLTRLAWEMIAMMGGWREREGRGPSSFLSKVDGRGALPKT